MSVDGEQAAAPPERKRKETADSENEAYRIYREIICDNIEYDILLQDKRIDRDRLDEIVDIILETVCSSRKKIRIAGDDYPAELVKSKFMKLNSSHIEFVFDCLRENTTKIRNIRQYLRAVLFNAPSTIDSYYTALVAHDSLYIAVINLDNIAVNQHFPGIDGEATRSHLLHFLLNQCPFLCGDRDTQHNASRSVCHSFTVLSVSNKGLGLSQQAMNRQGHFRECGYTPYACCGISFLTTTTVDTLRFSKPIRKVTKNTKKRGGKIQNYVL